ncbi:MAG: hypothetical protein JO019_02170 [Candidatus Kaiserbacteria bacterium]|nr:hypothetical protein [Candidatus Kaiserbacteria bacterium]
MRYQNVLSFALIVSLLIAVFLYGVARGITATDASDIDGAAVSSITLSIAKTLLGDAMILPLILSVLGAALMASHTRRRTEPARIVTPEYDRLARASRGPPLG